MNSDGGGDTLGGLWLIGNPYPKPPKPTNHRKEYSDPVLEEKRRKAIDYLNSRFGREGKTECITIQMN